MPRRLILTSHARNEDRILEWLLEPSQPAVRYRALIDLLDCKPSGTEARSALKEIAERGWAKDILSCQYSEGIWESHSDLYYPKYTATIWRLIVLADLGLTAGNPSVKASCELFLNGWSRSDGGFDSPGSTRSELCVAGNLARTLILCGYADDARVRSAIRWLTENQMEDGGWHCWPHRAFGRGTLDCWEGLSAFAALPRSKWTASIKRSVERGAEFYLRHELFRQGKEYLPWLRFHYPVHYYYDILIGLDLMTRLGYSDDRRLEPALNILRSKRRKEGYWLMDSIHPDLGRGAGYRMKKSVVRPFVLEEAGAPSKLITLSALRILKHCENY
ncbi:MAG: terpene cyclase/mutase family protein [Thermoplasmata archaeon YP2-bin.285]|uniref:Terpene cyclase/mutase family protein n=1 Tax=Candidatus Sysuiplasma superficiale TaxID=2823368 RepID=A0A8J7YQV2_9ARCH|nr:terpene cyclase/mutase family protein [Candidatus Sysuiplasma superficiale]